MMPRVTSSCRAAALLARSRVPATRSPAGSCCAVAVVLVAALLAVTLPGCLAGCMPRWECDCTEPFSCCIGRGKIKVTKCPSRVCPSSLQANGASIDCCAVLTGQPAGAKCTRAGAPGVTLTKVGQRCFNGWPPGDRWATMLEFSNYSKTDANRLCHCPRTESLYDKTYSWDERGGDLQCNGEPFCRVCGGLEAIRSACNLNPRCVGFVTESETRVVNESVMNWVPGHVDPCSLSSDTEVDCGFLKASMRNATVRQALYYKNIGGTNRAPEYRPGWDSYSKKRGR